MFSVAKKDFLSVTVGNRRQPAYLDFAPHAEEARMTIAIPQTAAAHPSERAALERDLQVLDAHKQSWAVLPPGKKSELFAKVKRATARVAERWVQAAVRAKGIPDGSPLAGEGWASGPWALLCGLTQYMRTLGEIARHGRPRVRPGAVRRGREGEGGGAVFSPAGFEPRPF